MTRNIKFAGDAHLRDAEGILNANANARDAMPEGGRLTFETRDVDILAGSEVAVAPGAYVAIRVSDAGTGILEDILPRIFEPFFMTRAPAAAPGSGSRW